MVFFLLFAFETFFLLIFPKQFGLKKNNFRHRGAGFAVGESSSVHVTGCTFDQVGGNGVLFSNAVIDSQVTNSEFVQCD